MVPLASAHRRRASWWWVFGVLIALPAIALALLGASAIRSDEVERQRQLLDQRQQFALLTGRAERTHPGARVDGCRLRAPGRQTNGA